MPTPCQKCYQQIKRGGGDCVFCYKPFCQKGSTKIEVGKIGDKTLYGIVCKECETKKEYKKWKERVNYELAHTQLNQKKQLNVVFFFS